MKPWLTVFLCAIAWVPCHGQLKTAVEVRSLSFEEADTGKRVDVSGVVIFVDLPSTIFIQDQTAGTFFRLGGNTPPSPGDEVRVRGETHTGLYLPGIENSTFEILGHPGIPEALPVSYDDLISGRHHYERVAIEGVVRTIEVIGEGETLLRLAMGSRVVEVHLKQPPPPDADTWIDRRISVSGLAAGHINARRQLVAPYLRCSDWSDLKTIAQRGKPPELSMKQILNFTIGGQGGHLVRVKGTVLAAFPGGEIFLRSEEDSAIAIQLLPGETLPAVGQPVEISGFPEMERFSASLVDARVVENETEAVESPEALSVSMAELMNGETDGNLVTFEARLVDTYRTGPKAGILALHDKDLTIQARAPELPGNLTNGMLLRVTGICRVESTQDSEYRSTPESVSLLLRSRDDISVLAAPSWWTAKRLGLGLALLLGATLLAGLWIVILRLQVSNQTVALRQRIEHEAALEERQRIAREFHDTLEQELAGLSIRLDAAVAQTQGSKLAKLLEGSRNLVSRIQVETRNLVSDLRATDRGASLEGLLRELADNQPPELNPPVRLHYHDSPEVNRLSARAIHHLGMIAREAVTNALKHAQAETIEIEVTQENENLVLKINDDGEGFDAHSETRGKAGHFGCMGIRERCARLGAEVEWKSERGKGTSVVVSLPLSEERK